MTRRIKLRDLIQRGQPSLPAIAIGKPVCAPTGKCIVEPNITRAKRNFRRIRHRGGIKLFLRRQLWIERIAGIVVLPLKSAIRLHMLKCAASAKHQKRIASYRRRHAIPVNVVSIYAEKENGRSSVHL